MDRRLLIGAGILILVVLGFLFVTNMTGHVITGSASNHEIIHNEYFLINDSENVTSDIEINESEVKNG